MALKAICGRLNVFLALFIAGAAATAAFGDALNFTRVPYVCQNLLLGQQQSAPYGASTLAALNTLAVRYQTDVQGLDAIRQKGQENILFLVEHSGPADPAIMAWVLAKDFHPRPVMDEEQVQTKYVGSLIKYFASQMSAILLPSPLIGGKTNASLVTSVINETAHALLHGNVYLYPSGRLKRSADELIGNTTIVERILERVPNVRIVLVRQRGYWGSSFSWGSVDPADAEGMNTGKLIMRGLVQGAKTVAANGIFFAPKRKIRLVFSEPANFPRHGTHDQITSYMQNYFRGVDDNDPEIRTHVPYYFWQGRQTVVLPPNDHAQITSEAGDEALPPVDPDIAATVLRVLKRESGRSEDFPIYQDLSVLDSMNLVTFRVEIETEFNITIPESVEFKTAYDVAAYVDRIKNHGETIDEDPVVPSQGWQNNPTGNQVVTALEGVSIPEKTFHQYLATPDKVIAEDRMRGPLTYKDVMVRSLAVAAVMEDFPGDKIGLLVPASSGGPVLYLASHLAGKVPVPINFTSKPETIVAAIESLKGTAEVPGLDKIITSRAAIKIISRTYDVSPYMHRFVYLEDYATRIKINAVKAMIRLKLDPKSVLAQTRRTQDAVILFTSGSSGTPKAVPLTHENVLTNLDDIMTEEKIREDARLLISLPPFHSFGHLFQALSLVYGVPAVYHSNPQDFAEIAKLMQAYGVTATAGMPLHLESVARKLRSKFEKLTLLVLGGAAAKDDQFDLLEQIFPNADIAEGYGTTETSPVISFNFPGMTRRGTIGKVVRSMKYLVVDQDTHQPVKMGEDGMLMVRGPSVFRGYLNSDADPFVTIGAHKYYETGDIVSELATLHPGTRNDLKFKDRGGRMIKVAGEKVFKGVLEQAFRPFFEERRPHNEDGTLYAGDLFVIESKAEDDSPLILFSMVPVTLDEILIHARELGLPGTARISEVRIVPEIPQLGVGKTDYKFFQNQLSSDAKLSSSASAQ